MVEPGSTGAEPSNVTPVPVVQQLVNIYQDTDNAVE